MKNSGSKPTSPILEKLPDLSKPSLFKPKIKITSYSKTNTFHSDLLNSRCSANRQQKNGSPKEFPSSTLFDKSDINFSEDFKKLNMYFSEASLNKSLLAEYTFEEINHGPPAGRKDAKLLIE